MKRGKQRFTLLILFAAGVVGLGMDCPYLRGLPMFGEAGPGAPGTTVMLRIINESGLHTRVQITFFVGEHQVRETTRLLAAEGADSEQLVVPTATQRIHIVAHEAEPLSPAAKVGDVLADAQIPVAPDTPSGETITFVIHPPGWADCNQNDVDDASEITDGLAADCNTNGIPDGCEIVAEPGEDCDHSGVLDECEIAGGVSADCNGNGIPDACDIAAGVSRDCNVNGVPDECDISDHHSGDCNANHIPDECDIATGFSSDCNINGIPDECESPAPVILLVAEQYRIVMTDQDGTSPVPIVTLDLAYYGPISGIAIDIGGSRRFFAEAGVSVGEGTIQSSPQAGGPLTMLISQQSSIGRIGLDLSNGKMYWTAMLPDGDLAVRHANLDGTGPVADVITHPQDGFTALSVDILHNKLYFARIPFLAAFDLIQRANLDGSGIETLVSTATDPADLDVWPERNLMFWTEVGKGGGVFRADLDGNAAVRIVAAPTARGVAVDRANCRVYWTEVGAGGPTDASLNRAELDGSNPATVLTGLNHASDVVVHPAPPP